jgi:hypothetical protein
MAVEHYQYLRNSYVVKLTKLPTVVKGAKSLHPLDHCIYDRVSDALTGETLPM